MQVVNSTSPSTICNLPEKYRPRLLSQVLGQEWIIFQLREYAGNPASNAFIFSGGTGVGKTSIAHALATELGVIVDEAEMGGLHQIASGEQTGESVRRKMDSLHTRPFVGSGWKVLIINEADAMSPGASYVWLDALENLPQRTTIIFTTNNASKLPRRLRDRCEEFQFNSGSLILRPAMQELIERVWTSETGESCPYSVDQLGGLTDENGDASFRRTLQRLATYLRAHRSDIKVPPCSSSLTATPATPAASRTSAAVKAWETRRRNALTRKEVACV